MIAKRATRQMARRLCRMLSTADRNAPRRMIHQVINNRFGKKLTAGIRVKRWIHATRPSFQKDYYEVLGISKSASKSDIKKAYYKLAKKWHPDTNKGDKEAEKRFTEISHAYEILSDDEKRTAYDQFGHNFEQAGGGGFGGPGGFQGFTNAEDLFREFFSGGGGGNPFGGGFGGGGFPGAGGGPPRPEQGGDLQTVVSLDFMEAVDGVKRDIRVQCKSHCNDCEGSGYEKGSVRTTCPRCKGSGVEVFRQGFFEVNQTCGACGGRGFTQPVCGSCQGAGLVWDTKEVVVNIPEGVEDGVSLRVRDKGDAGRNGGPRGHLYVKVQVRKHPAFRRQGADVHVDVPISVTQAILGGTVRVPLLRGVETIHVPEGTQPGDRMTLRQRGIKRLSSDSYGKQFVHFKIAVPKKLTSRQIELLEEFAKESGELLHSKDDHPASHEKESTTYSLFQAAKDALFGCKDSTANDKTGDEGDEKKQKDSA